MVNHVAVNACEAALLKLLLQHRCHRHVKLSVEQQHVVALALGALYEAILSLLVGGIQIDEVAFLVGLVVLDERLILLVGVVLAIHVLEEGKIFGAVVEIVL